MENAKTDMYGTTEAEARNLLVTFLHDTLGEPQAELHELYLQDGRWQSHVDNSQRDTKVVFLQQHEGEIQAGFMNSNAMPDATLKRW